MTTLAKKFPKLRFRGFSGEWQEKKISDFGDVVTGSTPPTNDRTYYGNDYDFISPGDMDGSRYVLDTKTKLSKKGFLRSRQIIQGSTLFVCIGSTIGKVAQATKYSSTNQQINTVVVNMDNFDDFLYLVLLKNAPRIKQLAGEQAVPLLSKTDFSKVKVFSPTKPEQEKIAGFLGVVDEKIEKLQYKKELLEKYKKGMMQKIFSQEIRFPDFTEKWQEKKLLEIFEITRGYVLATAKMSRNSTDNYKYPVYSSQTKNSGLIGYYKDYLYEDAITWTTDGANAGDVNFRAGKFYCTNVCGVLISSKGYANTMLAEAIKRVARKYVSYVGNPKLMNNVMAQIRISVPDSIEEQQKIAKFLASLDHKIKLEESKLEQAKQFKRALLQQMFV